MKGILIGFVSVILLVLAFVIARGFYDGARYALAASAASAKSGTFGIGGIGPQARGPYTISGIIVMDTSQGIPAVPYIKYQDANGKTMLKQVVYLDARACAPGASDYPCAPTYTATTGYPSLSDGEAVTASGYIFENRFLVTSVSE